MCAVDVTGANILESGLGAVLHLPSIDLPVPTGEDGNARSRDHYFYTTNHDPGVIYKIDLSGQLAGQVKIPVANFEGGLAYVNDALGPERDMLYALDFNAKPAEFVEFDPATLDATGTSYTIPDGYACAGGSGRLFVQVLPPNAQPQIQEINPTNGAVINTFNTPRGVRFDGLAFDGAILYGSQVVYPNSILWRLNPNTGQVIATGGQAFWLSALGAKAPSAEAPRRHAAPPRFGSMRRSVEQLPAMWGRIKSKR